MQAPARRLRRPVRDAAPCPATRSVYRRQLLALKDFFTERHATVLLLDDRSSAFGDVQPESLVGGNIVLERSLPAVRAGPGGGCS